MSTFKERRLQQELSKMSDDELIHAIQQGFEEGKQLTNSEEDQEEWKLIRDTIIAIGKELERRKI
jgi:hypothetical protein